MKKQLCLVFLTILFLLAFISCTESGSKQTYTDNIVYRTKGQSFQNYYFEVVPDIEIRGVLVLTHGFGMSPEKFLYEMRLDNLAAQNGILTIAPTLNDWQSNYLDMATLDTIDVIIKEISNKHNLKGMKFIIGGFSIGGTGALRYAEYFNEGKSNHNLELKAAFAVDPPLDFERVWYSMERTIERNSNKQAVAEATYFLDLFRKKFGGPPKENLNTYYNISPFSASADGGGRAKLLDDLPIRFYSEPDTNWWKENRGASFKDLNYYDIDGMANELTNLGNKHIEVIKTDQKGYRKDGTRHPHSWSIVDEQELLSWIINKIDE